MPFDLFISYARRDNASGRITQLVERIKQDFADFAKRELVSFFDQQEIHGMQDWRQRILQGLRESRLLLACLSPAYLQSEYCEWEFVEYLKYEIGHLHGFNGVAPIYFVEVPGWDSKDFEQQCAAWVAELHKRQHFDLRPWHDRGEEALREAAVQEGMDKLNRQIVQTITRGERAEKGLGNVDAHNPHFIGRTANLRMLRENFVTPGHIGVVTAVNGVGGLGKTALAIEYAHAFADEYGGGRWQVRCAGKDDLRLALAELAAAIGFEFTDDEMKNADLQFERTRRELKKLADAREPHRCLLLLDNVDRPGLLDPAQVARLNGGDWLHVLATTRLGENELHGAHRDRSFLAIDELPPDDALALIESYQPDGGFRSEAERKAAQEIVRLLGCFTLAVESAAVYLGQFANDVTCAAFLARLKKEGLEGLDTAASQSSEGVLHGEKRLGATLQPTLERLGAAEKLTLEFAALLPPDQVPLPWLRALVAKTFPEMDRDAEAGYPDPWKNVLRALFSLRLLTPGNHPDTARLHRMVAAYLLKQTATVSRDLLEEFIRLQAYLHHKSKSPPAMWELLALKATLLQLLERNSSSRFLANAGLGVCDLVKSHCGLAEASEFARAVHRELEQMAKIESPSDELKRSLSISLSNLGDLAHDNGRLSDAETNYSKALSIRSALRSAAPDDIGRQRDVAFCLGRLAEIYNAQGKAREARRAYEKATDTAERLSRKQPNEREWQHDCVIYYGKLGEMALEELKFAEAAKHFEKAYHFAWKVYRSEPDNPDWQRSLALCHESLGDLAFAQNDFNVAYDWHSKRHVIAIRLAEFDPANLTWLHDLGISHERLGDVAAKQNKLADARKHYEERQAISQRLRIANPADTTFLRDSALSLSRLGSLARLENKLSEAQTQLTEALTITQTLARRDPTDTRLDCDMAVLHEKLGNLFRQKGDTTEASRHFSEAMQIVGRLNGQESHND